MSSCAAKVCPGATITRRGSSRGAAPPKAESSPYRCETVAPKRLCWLVSSRALGYTRAWDRCCPRMTLPIGRTAARVPSPSRRPAACTGSGYTGGPLGTRGGSGIFWMILPGPAA